MTARADLLAGLRYALKLEYYEQVGEAMVRLLWSSPSTPKQPVPRSQLYAGAATPTPDSTAGSVASGTDAASAGESAQEEASVAQGLDGDVRAALADRITKIVTVAEKRGEAALTRLGRWETEGSALYAIDRRGYVEYEVNAPAADIYQLEVEGTSHNQRDLNRAFHLLISVDGEYLGRRLLDAGFETTGVVRILTPWLKPGPHRVRIYWDNARRGRSFELVAVRLQELQGPDTDRDGIKDWTRDWLRKTCGVEAPEGNPSVIRSATSPVCLEGRGRYLSMLQIARDQGSTIKVQPAPGNRWYANVPLSQDGPTQIEVSYENGGYRETRSLVWKPTNLLEAQDLTVRVGDALLVVAAPLGAGADPAPGGTMSIEVEGAAPHVGQVATPCVCRFEQPGTFSVKGAYTDPQGVTQSNAIHVQVVAASLGDPVAAWVGNPRVWECPGLTEGVLIQADPGLKLTQTEGPQRRFLLIIDEAEERYVVARLGDRGPILSGVRVTGFRLFSSAETNLEILQTYDDGTELIEMGLIQSPVLPEVGVQVRLVVGGVVFEDGTVVKRWQVADFNPLGEAEVRFLRPAIAKTSVCHKTTAWQGDAPLGSYR